MTFEPSHIVAQNVLHMYAEPSSATELVSQAVMGAPVRVLGSEGDFARIEGEDRYQGWVLSRWLAQPQGTADYLHTSITTLICDVRTAPAHDAPLRTKLTAGVKVVVDRQKVVGEYVPLLLPTGEVAFTHRVHLTSTYSAAHLESESQNGAEGDELRRRVLGALIERIGETARAFIGTPYLWGGTTSFGIDCSGFVQLVYRLNGLLLLRDAGLQYADRRFMPIEEERPMDEAALAPGDLVFFGRKRDSGEPRVTHVGMALGDGAFIHSAGGGRGNMVSPCSDPYYAASYLGARRLSPDAGLSIDSA